MLDSETKSRIDTARDILVGKIPNPQAQVEQITIAMIYKFMDDMDRQIVEAGGKRKFFSGSYSRYSWQNLMSPKLGGLEVLNLYSEAIQKMDINPNIPPLFREIFKNAYLPYKDSETLRSFLKTINGFNYDHSEKLGDAFEYLLSILGSQGDAGQFRTPRHIIDFMVHITDPQKGESILDPACGTAGFLISSYKHILKNNSSEFLEKKEDSLAFGNGSGIHFSGDKLTPDDRRMLPKNIMGYDISPDMVRLSLVNLYLHGFAEPNIFEYDTLTSEDKWNEYYNVILANPPFMSPKGGIRPHKRFSIESSRSEVLFVDYIAEHLTQFGRAAVIVPEGIIFQSGTAYKSLRKMLVEKCLYTVVSLPAGVFNPYSGVKTSILLLDKQLAQKTDNILFIKIENDGFDLGAQRRPMDKNDLPASAKAIKEYKESLITGKNFLIEDYPNLLLAPKSKISETGDYNLTGERYREQVLINFTYPIYPLSEVCDIYNGSTPLKKEKTFWDGGSIPWFTVDDIRKSGRIISKTEKYITQKALNKTSITLLPKHSVLLCCTASVGEYAFTEIEVTTNQQFNGLVVKKTYEDKLLPKFLFLIASTFKEKLLRLSGKTSFNFVSVSSLKSIAIPLPPIEVQREMVQEIESYQKIIDGARQIVNNYKPRITIDPKWDVVELGETAEITSGQSPPGESYNDIGKGIPFYQGKSEFEDILIGAPTKWTTDPKKFAHAGDVVMSVRAPVGPVNMISQKICIGRGLAAIRPKESKITSKYLFFSLLIKENDIKGNTGSTFASINRTDIEKIQLNLPPIEVQKEIVEQIEREQVIVNANKELIKIFEDKIKSKISSVWGEESE